MGTAVLSPQNYLPFQSHRHDRLLADLMDFASPSTHRVEGRMEQAFSQNHPSILSSSLSSVSSKGNLGSGYPSVPSRLLASRSLSVDPVVRRSHPSQNRRPFTPVQGNAMTNRFIPEKSKKPTGCDKPSRFTGREFNCRARNGRADLHLKKNEDTRKKNGRPLLEKADTEIYVEDGSKIMTESILEKIPVVTILRRPQTEKAALKLLAKYDWKTEGNPSLTPRAQEEGTQRCNVLVKSLSDLPAIDLSSITSPPPPSIKAKETLHNNEAATLQIMGCVSSQIRKSTMNSEMELAGSADWHAHTPPEEDERWAGPAYTNSPPPSSLPLPKFALKPRSYSWRDTTFKGVYTSNVVPDDRRPASAPPAPSGQGAGPHVDVAVATKDLRRILNLVAE